MPRKEPTPKPPIPSPFPPPAPLPRNPAPTPPESSPSARAESSPAPRSPAGAGTTPRPKPPTRQGGKDSEEPAPPPTPRKWSFLDVYEHAPIGPWDVLFRGDVDGAKKLNPKRWGPNIELDPVKRKKAQGPTSNQSIGGWFVEWAHAHLTGDIEREKVAAAHFLRELKAMTVKLFGGEQNSSTYYKYYIACGTAAVKWGDAWDQPEIAKYGRKMLSDYLALLLLHKTPVGIAMPGARVPRGVVGPNGKGAPEFEEICTLLETGTHPKLKNKKLDGGYEVAQWSLRELGMKFKPSISLRQIGQQWPLKFETYKNGEWLSFIPDIRTYDPVIAVSYVGGRLHELRWQLESGKHKAEVTRDNPPVIRRLGNTLIADYPQVGWSRSIPIPISQLHVAITIGGHRAVKA